MYYAISRSECLLNSPVCRPWMDHLGPDGRPAVYEGGAWVSQDRRYFWNGAAWLPAKRAGGPLINIGIGLLFLAIIGYAAYTTLATQSAYTIGFYVGVIAFFAALFVVFRFVGRWACFGIVIRGVCVILAVLKILTLIAHAPPA
jgi:hypothetical protein